MNQANDKSLSKDETPLPTTMSAVEQPVPMQAIPLHDVETGTAASSAAKVDHTPQYGVPVGGGDAYYGDNQKNRKCRMWIIGGVAGGLCCLLCVVLPLILFLVVFGQAKSVIDRNIEIIRNDNGFDGDWTLRPDGTIVKVNDGVVITRPGLTVNGNQWMHDDDWRVSGPIISGPDLVWVEVNGLDDDLRVSGLSYQMGESDSIVIASLESDENKAKDDDLPSSDLVDSTKLPGSSR